MTLMVPWYYFDDDDAMRWFVDTYIYDLRWWYTWFYGDGIGRSYKSLRSDLWWDRIMGLLIARVLIVTSRPKGRHVATTACPWMGLSFLEPSQEPTRHYDIIVRLKNENSKPNPEAQFLNFLTLKIYRKFDRVSFVNGT